MCRSIVFPFFFEMLIYFLVQNLLDVPHFCLMSCLSWICCLHFYLFHVPTNDENVVFWDATSKVMRSISSLTLVVLRLPLNVATIILGFIFSMLWSGFRDCGLISIPISPILALTKFFHADAKKNVHSLLVRYTLNKLFKSMETEMQITKYTFKKYLQTAGHTKLKGNITPKK